MNTQFLISSFRKEIWEFNKTLFWVPLLFAILTIVAPAAQFLLMDGGQIGRFLEVLDQLQHMENPPNVDKVVLGALTGLCVPFIMVALLVQLYYFITCLFDERRDLSVYFWRSLPVSDASAIGVKLVTGALLIPSIFMLGATLAVLVYILLAFIASIVLSTGYDISLWHLWWDADLLSNLASIWLGILPYALWMLPLYAWLMLASMYANKAPFLWAVIPVVAILLVESFLVQYFQLSNGFIGQRLMEYFKFGSNFMPMDLSQSEYPKLLMSSALFSKVSLGGVLLACALLYLTYWLRANRSQQ